MKCRYCGIEITGKPLMIGPKRLGLIYCSKKCDVFDSLSKDRNGIIAEAYEIMYPEFVKEWERMR